MIVNLPYDVAAQLDTIIDGEADGSKGRFTCAYVYTEPRELEVDEDWWMSKLINVSEVKDISHSARCGEPFNWGSSVCGYKKYYVTAIYRLEF